MAVSSLHGEWVSSAAYDYAKAQDFEKSSAAEVLQDLKNKFKDLDINGGGQQGFNNLTIAPNILQEMATSKEAREKYEALIYDINEITKNPQTTTMTGGKIKASGFIIGEDGGLSGWAISESGNKKEEKTMLEKLLESLEEKRQEDKEKNSIQAKTESLLDIKI